MLIGLFLVGTLASAGAQGMVGFSKEEVREMMQAEHPEFRRDASIVRQQFNYLKFVNSRKTRTWIIYFDDKDVSKSAKLVCDYAEWDDVVNELEAMYGKGKDAMQWTYSRGRSSFQVEITKQEWYFTVRESRL
ncbi:MAG: hypothetical protein R2751_12165 [Bacteroidales bacterium]